MGVNWKLCYDVEVPPVRGFSEFILDRAHLEVTVCVNLSSFVP